MIGRIVALVLAGLNVISNAYGVTTDPKKRKPTTNGVYAASIVLNGIFFFLWYLDW